jgi:hypothetical protein
MAYESLNEEFWRARGIGPELAFLADELLDRMLSCINFLNKQSASTLSVSEQKWLFRTVAKVAVWYLYKRPKMPMNEQERVVNFWYAPGTKPKLPKPRKNKDTPESKVFWTAVERITTEVATWPAWRQLKAPEHCTLCGKSGKEPEED